MGFRSRSRAVVCAAIAGACVFSGTRVEEAVDYDTNDMRRRNLHGANRFRGRPCPKIDGTRRQVLLLVVGSVRSFVYPTVHEYYHRHQVQTIQNSSDAQVHQIWYFGLDDASSYRLAPATRFPAANLTHLEYLQELYDVPVFETYDPSSLRIPDGFDKNPFNRNCTDGDYRYQNTISASYVQAYHFQNAFEIAMEYADRCDVANWTHVVRTRPDYVCTSPIDLNLNAQRPEGHFIWDSSWKYQVADYFYAMDRAAADRLMYPVHLDNFFDLPCLATPKGDYTPEAFLKSVVVYKRINLVSADLGMCALGRKSKIDCELNKYQKAIKCQNVERYAGDALRTY